MPASDRLRAVPRTWWTIAAGSALALLLVVAVAAVADGDSVPADRPAATTPTSTVIPATTAVTTEAATTTEPATTTEAAATTVATTSTSTTLAAIDLDEEYELDIDENDPAVVARPIPEEPVDTTPPSTIAPPPWAASTRTTEGGYLGVDVGCVDDLSAGALDRFFAGRVGPVIGWDYQHVYPLGDDRYLWLFQDAFVDHAGVVSNLGRARFVHNAALLQTGKCFTLLHRGSTVKPAPFEEGDGTGDVRTKWYWPMGGELANGQLWVFWAEMVKDPYDPDPPDGLGWHPNKLYLAAYDQRTLARLAFIPAADSGVTPIYGYAVSSDNSHTYLFGNTFEQNMVREGGFWNGPHSATRMWLARVPRGQLAGRPEYRTADGWSPNRADAVPILSRFYAENPMQPRYLDGQWVAATKVDGYWGEDLVVDVAADPWGPWTTVEYFRLQPRNNDPKMNSYHAHVLPWRDKFGSLLITVSNNARDMLRDAWPRPDRYRPMLTYSPYHATPSPPTTTTTTTIAPTTSTTVSPTTTVQTTTAPTTTAAPTTVATTTTPTTTAPPTTTTTVPPTSSTTPPPTTTIVQSTTTTTTASTTTSSAPPPSTTASA